jgi:hypothetical protein
MRVGIHTRAIPAHGSPVKFCFHLKYINALFLAEFTVLPCCSPQSSVRIYQMHDCVSFLDISKTILLFSILDRAIAVIPTVGASLCSLLSKQTERLNRPLSTEG